MKLKHIFTLLGAVLLGLTACTKDTPNTSDTLVGSLWECIVKEPEENGKAEITTIHLQFVDDTKLSIQSTTKTLKNGVVINTEVEDLNQGTYTYQDNVFTLIIKDANLVDTRMLTLTMDSSKQQLTGKVSSEAGTILTFVRKK